ncbi:hypothetical protein HMPREF1071_01440 [Bacteroides salyersiae CL02T12C01]|jgi:putative carbamoyl-phosphate-synthetase|uniref:ATP-grasp domain-containing protein n=1 Tax=Bacteroides salyersiae CL02T12C01 TaxID=997887 RepID=I9I1G7_9BACE|nr:ATP-grasp domain-containing protein [Bacteroides salyersiae]EIY66679.1 hypothetical protein HMPREF1071_01440 [Bacteroides salyersiae CL02T12C01]
MNNKSKKILLLGGLRYLVPVIKAIHELGYYAITCDYIPDNIAHKYSDEYHNINITDKESILKLAYELKIDGIMSFAVDPGVTTAAYVSEKLGLPGLPYESVNILQNKALFRNFLAKNGFTVPKSKGYKKTTDALKESSLFNWPIIVKPVDSAGSKGVTKVEVPSALPKAIEHAINFSLSKEFIIEEFIEKQGFSSDSEAFSINGTLEFISYSDQRFDNKATNPYTPSAFSWPTTMQESYQTELSSEIQRLLTLLKIKTSIFNIETCIGKDGKAYIMEVSPRGGGNRLAEMLHYATGIDLIKNAVRAAVGEDIVDITQPQYNGYWGEIILHGNQVGIFDKIEIDDDFKHNHVVELDLWVQKGDPINSFNGANDTIGTLVTKFNSAKELSEKMEQINQWIKIVVK